MLEADVVRRRRWPWIVVATVIATTVVATAVVVVANRSSSNDTSPPSPPFNLRSVGRGCPDDGDWVCGSIRVPLDRSSPRAGSTTVRYRVLPRAATNKQSAGTIVIVDGGPGSASMKQHVWAQKAFRSLLTDHDLLLVDNRGTGASDAIDCPKAQKSFAPAAIAQCRKILGSNAGNYSTVAAVDDLDVVLTRLHSRAVDLYGESYGTFFAQVFALRHPQHLERLVLDGALLLDPDPWRLDSIPAGLDAVRATCRADPACRSSDDPTALLADVLALMRAKVRPGYLSDEARELAAVLANAGRGNATYRELPSALRAYVAGDDAPLSRLIDENAGRTFGTTPATSISNGLFLAATCVDAPQPFDLRAPLAVQQRQLNSSYRKVVASNPRTFSPFTAKEALNSGSAPVLCLGWPAPAGTPLGSRHHDFPDIPTLVLEGGLDTVTPPPVARAVAREFRHGRYVEVPFVRHIAAPHDYSGCAAQIAAAFIRSKTIKSGCLSQVAAPDQVDAFPQRFGFQEPIRPLHANESAGLSGDDLRTVATARDAIADVLHRWGPLGFYSGSGLRGGTFTTIAPLIKGDYRVHLDGIAWSDDTAVSGELETSDASGEMSGFVVVSTPLRADVTFDVRASLISFPGSRETVAGTLAGREVVLTVAAKLGS